jgi:ribose/xylose/arabinose/galactoside ABC-type transport system permease subunit
VGEINNYQPLSFPLLFFIPAMAMDRVMQKVKQADWIKAVLLATVFGAILLAVQYPFSTFLVESAFARNWFFGADSVYPGVNPNAAFRSSWRPQENQYFPIILLGALKAIIAGIFIARISLGWGNRMQRIRR